VLLVILAIIATVSIGPIVAEAMKKRRRIANGVRRRRQTPATTL
jgi:hypothetical protein